MLAGEIRGHAAFRKAPHPSKATNSPSGKEATLGHSCYIVSGGGRQLGRVSGMRVERA